jgi:hypothetical protein
VKNNISVMMQPACTAMNCGRNLKGCGYNVRVCVASGHTLHVPVSVEKTNTTLVNAVYLVAKTKIIGN